MFATKPLWTVFNQQNVQSICFTFKDTFKAKASVPLYYNVLYYTVLYCALLYHTVLYYTTLYCTALYYTVVYYTILYYTILHYTTLHYTMPCYSVQHATTNHPVKQLNVDCNRPLWASLWLWAWPWSPHRVDYWPGPWVCFAEPWSTPPGCWVNQQLGRRSSSLWSTVPKKEEGENMGEMLKTGLQR